MLGIAKRFHFGFYAGFWLGCFFFSLECAVPVCFVVPRYLHYSCEKAQLLKSGRRVAKQEEFPCVLFLKTIQLFQEEGISYFYLVCSPFLFYSCYLKQVNRPLQSDKYFINFFGASQERRINYGD